MQALTNHNGKPHAPLFHISDYLVLAPKNDYYGSIGFLLAGAQRKYEGLPSISAFQKLQFYRFAVYILTLINFLNTFDNCHTQFSLRTCPLLPATQPFHHLTSQKNQSSQPPPRAPPSSLPTHKDHGPRLMAKRRSSATPSEDRTQTLPLSLPFYSAIRAADGDHLLLRPLRHASATRTSSDLFGVRSISRVASAQHAA